MSASFSHPAILETKEALGETTLVADAARAADEVAKRTGQARAAVINMALYRALEGDIFK